MLLGNSRVVGLALLLPCLALGASSAGATLIDDFSGTPAVGSYSTPPDALGLGVVLLPLASTNELDFLGDLQGMHVVYSFNPHVDFTEAGGDALSLDILDIVPSTGPITLSVSVNGGTVNGGTEEDFLITSTGPVLMPFADFANQAAFADVTALELHFTSSTYFAFAADDLQTIPEPASAALLALGLLGLTVAGRRQGSPSRPADRRDPRPPVGWPARLRAYCRRTPQAAA